MSIQLSEEESRPFGSLTPKPISFCPRTNEKEKRRREEVREEAGPGQQYLIFIIAIVQTVC